MKTRFRCGFAVMLSAPYYAPNHPALFMLSHAHPGFSRPIFSIGTGHEEHRSVRPEAQAGGLDHVFVGTGNLGFRRAPEVHERELLPRRGAWGVRGCKLAAEQEFQVPVVRAPGEALRRVGFRDDLRPREFDVRETELFPRDPSSGVL